MNWKLILVSFSKLLLYLKKYWTLTKKTIQLVPVLPLICTWVLPSSDHQKVSTTQVSLASLMPQFCRQNPIRRDRGPKLPSRALPPAHRPLISIRPEWSCRLVRLPVGKKAGTVTSLKNLWIPKVKILNVPAAKKIPSIKQKLKFHCRIYFR